MEYSGGKKAGEPKGENHSTAQRMESLDKTLPKKKKFKKVEQPSLEQWN